MLHWHIVDSQRYFSRSLRIPKSEPVELSFPFALEGFLELAEKGAYSSSKQYTANDLDEIVAYANSVRRFFPLRTPIYSRGNVLARC